MFMSFHICLVYSYGVFIVRECHLVLLMVWADGLTQALTRHFLRKHSCTMHIVTRDMDGLVNQKLIQLKSTRSVKELKDGS